MDKIINPHEFAIAVVSANSHTGSPEEIAKKSLELYTQSYDAVINHNEPIRQKQLKNQNANTDAFLEAFS